ASTREPRSTSAYCVAFSGRFGSMRSITSSSCGAFEPVTYGPTAANSICGRARSSSVCSKGLPLSAKAAVEMAMLTARVRRFMVKFPLGWLGLVHLRGARATLRKPTPAGSAFANPTGEVVAEDDRRGRHETTLGTAKTARRPVTQRRLIGEGQ